MKSIDNKQTRLAVANSTNFLMGIRSINWNFTNSHEVHAHAYAWLSPRININLRRSTNKRRDTKYIDGQDQ